MELPGIAPKDDLQKEELEEALALFHRLVDLLLAEKGDREGQAEQIPHPQHVAGVEAVAAGMNSWAMDSEIGHQGEEEEELWWDESHAPQPSHALPSPSSMPISVSPSDPLEFDGNPDLVAEEPVPVPSDLEPVEVIITARSKLQAKYGDEALQRIEEKLEQLVKAIATGQKMEARVIYVDEATLLRTYGLAPADFQDPYSISALLAALDKALASQGKRMHFVLIIGGDGIIPFFRLPNPTEDPDREVISDAPFAGGENWLLPQRAVGRIPDGDSDVPDLLLTLLEGAILAQQKGGTENSGFLQKLRGKKSLGLSAQIWQKAAALVYSPIGSRRGLEVSPPATDVAFLEKYQEVPALAYFNLHGVENSPYWYGHQAGESEEQFPIALTPQNLAWAPVSSSVVYSEACYGAQFWGRKAEESLALSFLKSGARAFVGSTAMSYGSLEPPLSGADLLGMNLWRGLLRGYPVGEALRRAKLGLVEEMGTRQGFLDGEDQKTILSFILLGDPSLPAPVPLPLRRNGYEAEAIFCPPVVCGPKVRKMGPVSVPREVVNKMQKGLGRWGGLISGQDFLVKAAVLCSGDCGCSGCPLSGSKGVAGSDPFEERLVFSAQQEIPVEGEGMLQQVVRVTTNAEGKVLKVAVSR